MPQQPKFDEAIAFYKQKMNLPTEVWEQIINESQDWAFTVAGVEKANVLQSVFDMILKVLEGRSSTVTTYEDFAKNFNKVMVSNGYGEQKPWRSRIVFAQNTKTAYNAGRYRNQSDPEAIKRRPYLQYIHDHPIIPRPHHKALHLKVFRTDDPIWDSIYPNNGFNCECAVVSLSERDLQREGLEVSDSLTETITLRDKLTGNTQVVPAISVPKSEFEGQSKPYGAVEDGDMILAPIAEFGFNFAPGKSQEADREAILGNALSRLSPRLRKIVDDI